MFFVARENKVVTKISSYTVCTCSISYYYENGLYDNLYHLQCSVTCGNGVQTRSVDCVMTMSGDVVSDTMCIARNKPLDTRSCFPMTCPSEF